MATHPGPLANAIASSLMAAILCLHLATYSQDVPAAGTRSELPELVVQSGHSGSITAIVFSSHDFMATASVDGTVKVWQVATGQLLRTFVVSEYWVYSAKFSPDERLLATGSGDNVVRLWDLHSGRLLKEFTGNAHAVRQLVFSVDGQTLASGSSLYARDKEGESVCSWDLNSGKKLLHLAMPGKVSGLKFAGPSKLIVATESETSAWNVQTGERLKSDGTMVGQMPDFAPGATVISVDPKGRWQAVAQGATFKLSGVASQIAVQPPQPPVAVRAISFSRDGRLMAVGHANGNITIWNLASGLPDRSFHNQQAIPHGVIHSVGFTPNADELFGAAWDSGIWLWKRSSTSPPLWLHSPESGLQPESVLGTPRTRAELNPPPGPPSPPRGLTASVDGGHSPVTEEVYCATISTNPNNKLLAYGGFSYDDTTKSNFFSVIDWESRQKIDYVLAQPGVGDVKALAFSPNGNTLAVGYADGTLGLRDVHSQKFLHLEKQHSRSIYAVAFSPDGKFVASGGADNIVRIWDANAGSVRFALEGHTAPVLSLTFSADGRLVSGGSDDQIIVWDSSAGKPVQTLQGHSSAVNTLAYVPQRDILVSGSEDGTVRFWAGPNYKPIASAVAFAENEWLAFTPEGFFDGTPRAWQLVPFRFPSEPNRLYQPEQFFNEFYQPGLLSDVFEEGKPLLEILRDRDDPRSSINISSYRNSSLPKLRITVPSVQSVSAQRVVEVTVEAEDTGSGLRDLRLFRNQSLVHIEHGELHPDPASRIYRITLPLKISADENRISAYVFNRDNIKSKDANLTITGDRKLSRKGTAYLIAIGVNEYANPEFNLRYADADAQAMVEALSNSLSLLKAYDRIVPLLLLDARAVKSNILAALERLGGQMENAVSLPELNVLHPTEPEDAVIIYFAGHGMARGDHYYLVPHDLGYAGDPRRIDAQGWRKMTDSSLSDTELEQALETIAAPHILLILDACQSGQVLQSTENRRGPMNSKGLGQLAYEKGAYLLAAAQSFQAALEFKKLGHGVLTYVLLEQGLRQRAADIDPPDGEVTVSEWLQYATQQVPVEVESGRGVSAPAGRSADFKAVEDTGQAPRSYFRPDTTDSWVVAGSSR